MGLRDRLLYAALAGALGGVLGGVIAVVAFVRVLRGTQGADPGAMVWHWALWSAVVFGLLGLLRGARAADTLGDSLSVLTLNAADPSRATGGRPAWWPLVWVGAGYLLIWWTRPGA